MHFISHMSEQRRVSREEFAAYAEPLRPLIHENFRIGASEQLVQFKAQMKLWKEQFPDEKWGELRVVVLGFHQAREQFALSEFFQWLLKEPGYENRVVFAEFQGSLSGAAREAAEAEGVRSNCSPKWILNTRRRNSFLATERTCNGMSWDRPRQRS